MSFTGDEDHTITLDQAAAWTKNYRGKSPNEVQGHFFGRTAIKNILAQANCVGIRIYYALDEKGQKQLIVVGVTSEENDLYTGLLAERSNPCPPICGVKNPLNS